MEKWKKPLLFTTIATLFVLFTSEVFAVPAFPGELTFQQPDGESFQARLKGDEWFSWIETSERFVIIKNKATGYFEYAVIGVKNGGQILKPSGIIANQLGPVFGPPSSDKALESIKVLPISRQTLGEMWKRAIEKRKFK